MLLSTFHRAGSRLRMSKCPAQDHTASTQARTRGRVHVCWLWRLFIISALLWIFWIKKKALAPGRTNLPGDVLSLYQRGLKFDHSQLTFPWMVHFHCCMYFSFFWVSSSKVQVQDLVMFSLFQSPFSPPAPSCHVSPRLCPLYSWLCLGITSCFLAVLIVV